MTREELLTALKARNIDGPDRLCADLSDEAIEGAIRWFDHEKFTLGKNPASALLAWKLRQGGAEGFGAEYQPLVQKDNVPTPSDVWWRTWQGRERWIETNVSELNYEYAESAIISLVQQKKNPTPETVRACAQLLEQDQLAHDEKCRQAVKGQRALSGREQVAREPDGSAERGERDATSAAPKARDPLAGSRPESVQKAAA